MDTGLLLLRLVVGTTLAAHGAQKLFGWFGGPGLAGAGVGFESARLHARPASRPDGGRGRDRRRAAPRDRPGYAARGRDRRVGDDRRRGQRAPAARVLRAERRVRIHPGARRVGPRAGLHGTGRDLRGRPPGLAGRRRRSGARRRSPSPSSARPDSSRSGARRHRRPTQPAPRGRERRATIGPRNTARIKRSRRAGMPSSPTAGLLYSRASTRIGDSAATLPCWDVVQR